MNKTVVGVVLIAGMTVVLSVGIHAHSRRYYLQTNGDATYKIDRRTGKTWLVRGTGLRAVTAPDPDSTGKNQAITLARLADTLKSGTYNYKAIEGMLRKKNTRVEVYGWNAEKSGASIYTVVYSWNEGKGTAGYTFEVNTELATVKLVER